MEPVTSARYCDSCGSRLSSAEMNACESPVVGPDHWAPDGEPGSDTRCDSCGGPNANGDLCGSCQRAFFSSWLDGATPAPPATTVDPAPIQEIPWSELATSDAFVRDSFEPATLAETALPAPGLVEQTMNSLDAQQYPRPERKPSAPRRSERRRSKGSSEDTGCPSQIIQDRCATCAESAAADSGP